MMRSDDPEPLWSVVGGDKEPWRRGRLFLIALAIWSLISQSLLIGSQLLLGRIEFVLGAGVGAAVSWLLFYFIWIGVHWVRWLSGGFLALLAFANLIWGIRDGNPVRIVDGSIGFPIAAYLALAPSVYFFALRQKEVMRWKEALVVAAVFALLLISFGAAIFGLSRHKAQMETRGRVFADRAFHRIFVEGDAEFLRTHATTRLMREAGWERLSGFMADRSMRVGVARDVQPARGRLRFWFRFPGLLGSEGRMSAEARSDQGPVRFYAVIGEAGGQWQIDAISWIYIDPASFPGG